MRGKVTLRKSKDSISKAMYRQTGAIASCMEHLEKVEVLRGEEAIAMDIQVLDLPKGKWLLKAEGLSVSYRGHSVLKNVRFLMKNHSRVALIGENGCGRTTLLQATVQGSPAIWKIPEVKIDRLLQQFENLGDEQSVYENAMADSAQGEHAIHTTLDRLLFQQQDLRGPIAVLSGGERMRLGFAKLMVGSSNLPFLGEPTNYLDLLSIRCIAKLLQDYEGSVLSVSHDVASTKEATIEVWELRKHTLYMPQDCVKPYNKKQGQIDPDIVTKRMILDMRRNEMAHRLTQTSGDRGILEKEYAKIMEELKNPQKGICQSVLFMIPWTVADNPDRREMRDSRIHETSQGHQGDEILSRSLQIIATGGFVDEYIRPNIKRIFLTRRTDTLSYMNDSIADVFCGSFNSFLDAKTPRRYNSRGCVDVLHRVGEEYEAMMKWKAL